MHLCVDSQWSRRIKPQSLTDNHVQVVQLMCSIIQGGLLQVQEERILYNTPTVEEEYIYVHTTLRQKRRGTYTYTQYSYST